MEAALQTTWAALGCTNIPPNGTPEPCPGGSQCASSDPLHNGLLFMHSAGYLSSKMGLCLQRESITGLIDLGKTCVLIIALLSPGPLRRGNRSRERNATLGCRLAAPTSPGVWPTAADLLQMWREMTTGLLSNLAEETAKSKVCVCACWGVGRK